MAVTLEAVLSVKKEMAAKAEALVATKGHDYNSQQQAEGDTLFNMRVCTIMGIVPSPVDGVLVRLSDKLMRLISLTRPGVVAQVKDESIEDTVADIHNYADYVVAFLREAKQAERPAAVQIFIREQEEKAKLAGAV